MKTIHTLSNRKLDKLQARILGHLWRGHHYQRRGRIMLRIAEEREKRLTNPQRRILP